MLRLVVLFVIILTYILSPGETKSRRERVDRLVTKYIPYFFTRIASRTQSLYSRERERYKTTFDE